MICFGVPLLTVEELQMLGRAAEDAVKEYGDTATAAALNYQNPPKDVNEHHD